MLYVVLLVFAFAGVYFFTAQPTFTATAELFVDTHKISLLQQQQTLGIDAPVDSSLIDSHVEILKSENIAQAVIKDLHLLDDPEFTGPAGGLLSAIFGFVKQFLARRRFSALPIRAVPRGGDAFRQVVDDQTARPVLCRRNRLPVHRFPARAQKSPMPSPTPMSSIARGQVPVVAPRGDLACRTA